MKRQGTWKIWAFVFVIFGFIVAATVEINNSPVLNITGKGTKELIVVDAGHGGFDPGKVGTAGTLEKDINLLIALKLQKILEDSGYRVIMTRDTDTELCDAGATRKKAEDLKTRVGIINENKPALAVSIHQNSYHEEGIHGAQVFYYGTSAESKKLAEILQEELVRFVDPENHRQAKANDTYYLLKKTQVPVVIVEYCVSDRQTGL